MGQSLRELLIEIKVKVDKSGVKASDTAMTEATQTASGLEKALLRIAAAHDKISAAQKRANAKLSAQQGEFEKATGLKFGSGISPRAPRKGGIGSLAAPNIEDFTVKPKTALESLKERFNATFSAAGQKIQQASDKVDNLAGKLFNARTAIAGFAAAIVGRAIGEFIGDVVETGKSLDEMSRRTRVSVESLQGWRALIAKAGIDTSVLETSFRKLSKSARASEKATSPQAKAFKDLGVETMNAAKTGLRPIEDIMVDVGTALAGMTDDTAAAAIATQLLGPAGYGLVPAFEAGGDAVRKFLATAKENVSISTEEAERLKAVGDEVERGGKKWIGLKNRLVIALLPALEFVADKFEKVSKWLFNTAKNTQVFQTLIGALAAGGIARLVVALAAWVTRAGGARVVMGLLGQGLRSAAGFALRFIAPLLIIEDFLVFLAGGKSLFGRAFNEIFGEGGAKKVRDGLLSAFTKMKDVIGELGSAISGIGLSDLFTGAARVALDLVLLALNAIGVALSSNTDKANALAKAMGARKDKVVEDVGKLIGHKVDDARPQWQPAAKDTDPAWTKWPVISSVVGRIRSHVQNDDGYRADYARNNPQLAVNGVVPSPTANLPGGRKDGIVVNNNQQVHVEVNSSPNPGAVGRETAAAVTGALETDSRQTLSSVSE